jgi:tripartite ATP-independent transporter DctM subunit
MSILVPVLILVILLLLSMPIGYALGIAGAIGIWMNVDYHTMLGIIKSASYEQGSNYLLTTIPMFILMAEFMNNGSLTKKLFFAAFKWVGHLRGGMATSTVLAAAGMAAVSGSSTAASASLSSIVVPEMRKYKYNDTISVGVVSVAGTLACMIPPSLVMIMYGVLTESNIGKLFIAGIVPGIITVIGYCLTIYLWVRRKPEIAPKVDPFPMKERMETLKGIWPVLLLALSIIVLIYTGIVTPTEAAGVGAFFALLITLVMKFMKLGGIKDALSSTVNFTAQIITITIGAMIFGYFLTITNAVQKLALTIQSWEINPWIILVVIVIFYLLLGFVMDQMAILLLTIPITFPIIDGLGFDPIWYGIIITKTVEIGLATPPMGLNVFVAASAAKVPLSVGFKGVTRFVITDLIILTLLIMFPWISTWLPGIMK